MDSDLRYVINLLPMFGFSKIFYLFSHFLFFSFFPEAKVYFGITEIYVCKCLEILYMHYVKSHFCSGNKIGSLHFKHLSLPHKMKEMYAVLIITINVYEVKSLFCISLNRNRMGSLRLDIYDKLQVIEVLFYIWIFIWYHHFKYRNEKKTFLTIMLMYLIDHLLDQIMQCNYIHVFNLSRLRQNTLSDKEMFYMYYHSKYINVVKDPSSGPLIYHGCNMHEHQLSLRKTWSDWGDHPNLRSCKQSFKIITGYTMLCIEMGLNSLIMLFNIASYTVFIDLTNHKAVYEHCALKIFLAHAKGIMIDISNNQLIVRKHSFHTSDLIKSVLIYQLFCIIGYILVKASNQTNLAFSLPQASYPHRSCKKSFVCHKVYRMGSLQFNQRQSFPFAKLINYRLILFSKIVHHLFASNVLRISCSYIMLITSLILIHHISHINMIDLLDIKFAQIHRKKSFSSFKDGKWLVTEEKGQTVINYFGPYVQKVLHTI